MGKHKPTAAEWGSQVRDRGLQVSDSRVCGISRQSMKHDLQVFDLVLLTPAGYL